VYHQKLREILRELLSPVLVQFCPVNFFHVLYPSFHYAISSRHPTVPVCIRLSMRYVRLPLNSPSQRGIIPLLLPVSSRSLRGAGILLRLCGSAHLRIFFPAISPIVDILLFAVLRQILDCPRTFSLLFYHPYFFSYSVHVAPLQ